MDKDRIKGTVKKAEGAIKEALGKASGDESLEVEGKIEKAEGSIQKAFGKAKDSLRKS
ncbi:CsbD family protein [Maritimibacter sp. HL-12]|uniref:CsbD family protein n=1 Tax=Maritimibacter sp. HL-12 TaxID=1162418 RepID=UPI000A0EFDC6|nr:CsbD family protein [Maritimibacter sp. HL-12]SMH46833.1 CsbD-like [Maritimibacter sp. HL-12]